ncbi:MAG: hypothetical protein ACYDGR_00605 [Candidatus Dormibacteria bacterium]
MTLKVDELQGLKLRVYGSITVMVLAWSAMSLALGGALALAVPALYTLTLGGILAILGVGMRHPTYHHIRDRK